MEPVAERRRGCFPAADWPDDEGRSERPQECRFPNPAPSEMVDRIESDPVLQLGPPVTPPSARLNYRYVPISAPLQVREASSAVPEKPIGCRGQRHHLVRRRHERPNFVAKTVRLGRPVPAYTVLRTTIGGARIDRNQQFHL